MQAHDPGHPVTESRQDHRPELQKQERQHSSEDCRRNKVGQSKLGTYPKSNHRREFSISTTNPPHAEEAKSTYQHSKRHRSVHPDLHRTEPGQRSQSSVDRQKEKDQIIADL